jgi:two-component system, OmpR family, sensor kinase
MKRKSLSQRLALLISLGFAALWLLSVFVMGLTLREEQAELFDKELDQTAHLFRPIVTQAIVRGDIDPTSMAQMLENRAPSEPGETLIYQVISKTDGILASSPYSSDAAQPTGRVREGFYQTETHMFFTTGFNAQGYAVRVGGPLQERREAYFDSFIAFLLPMLAIVPLAYLLVGWVARTALRPLDDLRNSIAKRGETRLDPIDAQRQPTELAAITESMNGFMTRLSQSLEGERAFASSAAHELRTPVAIALAQVQRLQAETADPSASAAVRRIEEALQRMARLVARLLQTARAEAGVGLSNTLTDLAMMLRHVTDESLRHADRTGRLQLSLPDAPVLSPMDGDAFAIVAGNLIDNAFQHGATTGTVAVSLDQAGTLRVVNDCPPVDLSDLGRLTQRLHRGQAARDGFGLGLYIADKITRQVGSRLHLVSPPVGRTSGFEARFTAPRS